MNKKQDYDDDQNDLNYEEDDRERDEDRGQTNYDPTYPGTGGGGKWRKPILFLLAVLAIVLLADIL